MLLLTVDRADTNATLLQIRTQLFFEGQDGAALKQDVIRALKETIEMTEYDTPQVHGMVDPILAKLQA